MIEIDNERVIPLREVHKHLPSRCIGKRLSPATVWRWATKKHDALETIRIGGGRFTSIEAIARFINRSNTPPLASTGIVIHRSQHGLGDRAVVAGQKLRKLIDPKETRKRG
jgi:hypothetical protein